MAANPTQQMKMDGVEVKVPPRDDILVLYASDGSEWADRLSHAFLRSEDPGQVDSIPVDSYGGTEEERRSWADRGYGAVVAVITEGFARTNTVDTDFDRFRNASPAPLLFGVAVEDVLQIHSKGSPPAWVRGMEILPTDEPPLAARKDADHALTRIAVTIRNALDATGWQPVHEAPPTDGSLLGSESGGPTLAPSVQRILERAAGMHADSPGIEIDTTTLFLALGELGQPEGEPQWTADWLRGRASAVLDLLATRRHTYPREDAASSDPPGVSRGVRQALERATAIAARTTGAREIRARHLFAALVTDARGERSGLLRNLEHADVDVAELRADFFEFVRGDGDNDAEWSRVLFGDGPEPLRLSHFDADDSRSEDYLDVRKDVMAFAGLIAARTLTPPLSIGLFGEWGSGKTFFMRMLRGEVDRLAKEADRTDRMQRELPFWKRIIQIEFNAWHYVEGNLWASLVQHIFENLRFADEPRLSASQELQRHLLRELKTESEAEQKAGRDTREAERQVRDAERAVSRARQAYETQARDLAALSRKNLLADIPVPAIRAEVAPALDALGLEAVGSSALELKTALEEARGLLGRGRAVAAPLLYGDPGMRGRRWRGLVLALIAGPAVALAVGVVLALLGPEGIGAIAAWSAGIAAFLSSAAAWLRAQLGTAEEWIRQVEDAQRALDERVAKAQALSLQQIREAEERLRLREADYQSARRQQEDARRRAADARQRLREASLAGVLGTFIEDRAASTDYRKHLGTLALVRNDFERLSSLIEEENWRLVPEVPGEDTSRRGLPKYASADEERTGRERRINRIVLYIDDLDRCPPAKVVEVLQAVHLLLAFPLFVVVVGVDARWITRSLEARYRELLSGGGQANGDGLDEFRELFGSATAHDYLEKIFQVPFWLRTMNDGAARRMVRGLLAPSLVADEPSETGGGASNGASGDGAARATGTPPATDEPAVKGVAANPDGGRADPEDAEPHHAGQERERTGDPSREAPDLAPESLEIRGAELKFMNQLAPLLGRSPRALKRFVNVYRLIKAGLSAHERRVFIPRDGGAGDYQCVLFLLAVDTGAPLEAADIFRAIGGGFAEGTKPEYRTLDHLLTSNGDVKAWVRRFGAQYPILNDAERMAAWVRRVSRFSFHTGRVSAPADEGEVEAATEARTTASA